MLNQLLKSMTPELIIHAIKSNPKVVIETIQKFDTFKLLGQALNTEQQIALSKNADNLNAYLSSVQGRESLSNWVDGFNSFVEKSKEVVIPETTAELEARLRGEIEAMVRAELESKLRAEIQASSIAEIQNKIKDELAGVKTAKLLVK